MNVHFTRNNICVTSWPTTYGMIAGSGIETQLSAKVEQQRLHELQLLIHAKNRLHTITCPRIKVPQ